MILLKGDARTEDKRLDRVYGPDLNSLKYLVRDTVPLKAHETPRSYTWAVGNWLNQGEEGACVGFGYSHELLAKPIQVQNITNKFARETIYWESQRKDPWPGGSYPDAHPVYEGTSVLTGAKVLRDLGFYTGYRWGLTPKDIAMAIGYTGPSVLGITMYEQMMDPNPKGFLVPEGAEVGGHCILAHAVKIVYNQPFGSLGKSWSGVNLDRSYVTVWNSWGRDWGHLGTAKISLRSLEKLIVEDKGEACFPDRNTTKLVA